MILTFTKQKGTQKPIKSHVGRDIPLLKVTMVMYMVLEIIVVDKLMELSEEMTLLLVVLQLLRTLISLKLIYKKYTVVINYQLLL